MGYTHYWKFKQRPTKINGGRPKFEKSVNLLKSCIEKVPKQIEIELWSEKEKCYKKFKFPFKLAGCRGEGEPILTNTEVIFNGAGDDAHESFVIDYLNYGKDGKWFCKTNRNTYDVAVCLALLCFKHYFGDDFSYSSDGSSKDDG